ncbi:MAG: CDP-glycerol glycerophosphotransferase family protein [Candidatus Moraniibacteriota bacterium]
MYTEAKMVGNPKFDDWFDNDLDESVLIDLKEKLSKDKKTVLYLPTHGDLCSIDRLAEELKKISKEYNVIVKMHYFVIREEPEKIKMIENDNIIIYMDDVDLLPLLKVSDVVISDNSSAVFDAILADKPLVVTDFLSDDYLDNDHKKLRLSARGLIGAMTYSGSIEQEIKRKKLVITIDSPDKLVQGIKKAILDEEFFKNSRRQIARELFAFHDGKCGERAAEEIRKIDSRGKLKDRPIMYHAIEAFVCEMPELKRISHAQRILDQKRIRRYESMILNQSMLVKERKMIFSVIVIDIDREFIKLCLRSIFWQEFPKENYEIIMVSSRDEEAIARMIKEIYSENSQKFPEFKFIRPRKGLGIGDGIKKALEVARGEYICFTQSSHSVPLRWLFDIYFSYRKHPNVAGVGGYEKTLEKNYTYFDEFYLQEIGKKLGIWKEAGFYLHFYETIIDLFDNNPTGTLANVSYRKDILEKHKEIFGNQVLELAGLELKKRIMDDHEICFIPISATYWKKMTLKKFNQNNFRYGFLHRNLCQRYPELRKYYKYSIFSPFRFMLTNLLDGNEYKKLTISSIIFIAYSFRWFGGFSWKMIIFFSRLKEMSRRL